MKKILQVLGCIFLLVGAASYEGEDMYVCMEIRISIVYYWDENIL